jgi:hypothetical protein
MQRLAYLESRLVSEGRMIVIFEDAHFESTEARIDRCLAEVGRSPSTSSSSSVTSEIGTR